MKKILLLLTIFVFFGCHSSSNKGAATCCQTDQDAFMEFSTALKAKDFSRLKSLTSNANIDYEKIFGKYQSPKIEFLPVQKDGAYGIKNIGGSVLYYAQIFDGEEKKNVCAIMFQRTASCFKVINMPEVKISKRTSDID